MANTESRPNGKLAEMGNGGPMGMGGLPAVRGRRQPVPTGVALPSVITPWWTTYDAW